MKEQKLTFEIGQKKGEFDVFELNKQLSTMNSCYRIYASKKCIKEIFKEKLP